MQDFFHEQSYWIRLLSFTCDKLYVDETVMRRIYKFHLVHEMLTKPMVGHAEDSIKSPDPGAPLASSVASTISMRKLSEWRSNHIAYSHRHERQQVNMIKGRITILAAADLPQNSAGWLCSYCYKAIPHAPQNQLRQSARAHLMEHARRGQTLSLHDNWVRLRKKRHPRIIASSKAGNERSLASTRRRVANNIQEMEQSSGHRLVYFPDQRRQKKSRRRWSCPRCYGSWTHVNDIPDKCADTSFHDRLTHPSFIAQWKKLRTMKDKNLASRVANAWKLSQKQVNNLEEVMKTMVKKRHGKLPSKLRSWKRCLTEEGVEPNPGPSSLITIYSLNVAGKHKAWKFMNHCAAERIEVVIMQEINMNEEEQVLFANTWNAQGYSVYFPDKVKIALTAVAIHNSMKSRRVGCCSSPWGQVVSVEMQSGIVSGIYRNPRQELNFADMFVAHQQALGRYANWMAVGDWNLTPDEGNIQGLFPMDHVIHYPREANGLPKSTRWKGSRCIDWCASAPSFCPESFQLDDTCWSDHILLKLTIQAQRYDMPAVVDTLDCSRPGDMTPDEWATACAKLWDQDKSTQLIPRRPDEIQQCWDNFNKKLEMMLIAVGNKSRSGHIRPKGSCPTFKSTAKPHRQRTTQVVTFQERKCRKLLGRLHEALRQGKMQSDEVQAFVPRGYILPSSTKKAIAYVENKLTCLEHQQRKKALDTWKSKMRESDKSLFEYVGRRFIPWSLKVATHPGEECSGTTAESLNKITDWWNTIWKRDTSSLQSHIQFWKRQKPPSCSLHWKGFNPKALQARAVDMKQGSAGPDGWRGIELAELPETVWVDIAAIFNAWVKLRSTPKSLKHLRQSCIPKKESSRTDKALSPSDLRPIAVYSVWWRLFTSVIARDANTRAWQNVWMPKSCFGGRPKQSVIDAIAELQKSKGKWVLSLDLQKAFDFVHPVLATTAFKELGMSEDLTETLLSMWSHQKRWIALGRNVACSPCEVGSSLPQGDGLSPLAMNAVLSAAVRAVEKQLQRNESQCVYLDDRNVRVANLERAKFIQHAWAEVSQSLGLHENESKARLLCADKAKTNALKVGFTAEQVQPAIRVLGIDLTKNGSTPTGDNRIAEGLRRCLRLQRIPVSFQVRTKVVCASILSVACWGWATKSLSDNKVKKLKSAIGDALWRPELGSPDLHQLLTGHLADPQFRAGMWAARMWPTCGVVTKWLESLNWQKQADGRFYHPAIGKRFSIDHVYTDEIRHWLRESWRRIKWNMFINSQRRDTAGLTERSYDEFVCKATRKAFHETDSHGRAVLVGAPCSDAMFDIIGGQNPPSFCTWCSQNVCSTWHHLAWECKAFCKTRPPIPRSRLAARFGWQVGSPHDANVLEHLALVRAKLAASRRPSAGGMRLAGMA